VQVAVKVTVCPEIAGLGDATSVQSGATSLTWIVIDTGGAHSELEMQPVSVYEMLPGDAGAVTWIDCVCALPGDQL
jgi:hypothetical protein